MDRQVLQRGLLLFVLLLAFALRISGLTAQSLWRDEVDALRFARAPLSTLIGNFTRIGWNGPLSYILLRFWLIPTGSTEFALRFFSLLCGVLSVALVYRLGRTWFSARTGSLAALLTACSPYMVWYAQEVKMYALLCTVAIAALCLYHRAVIDRDWRAWVLAIVFAWITAGVHIMGGLLVPVMILLFFVWWPASRQQWRQALLALAGVLLPAIAVLPWVLPLLTRGGDIGHRFVPLSGMVTSMIYAFGRGIAEGGGLWAMGLALFLLLAGLALGPRGSGSAWLWGWVRSGQRPDAREGPLGEHLYVLATAAWLAAPLLGLYGISLRVPMFVDRYLIWIGPAFYLLMARGAVELCRRSRVVATACLAALLAFNAWGLWEQSATPIKSDFRAAAAYVQQHRHPEDLILFHISYVRETFEYYYGDSSPSANGISTSEETTEAAVDAAMREQIGDRQVIWLILSEPEMWDRRGMTVDWLEKHARAGMRADLTRVSVVRYERLAGSP